MNYFQQLISNKKAKLKCEILILACLVFIVSLLYIDYRMQIVSSPIIVGLLYCLIVISSFQIILDVIIRNRYQAIIKLNVSLKYLLNFIISLTIYICIVWLLLIFASMSLIIPVLGNLIFTIITVVIIYFSVFWQFNLWHWLCIDRKFSKSFWFILVSSFSNYKHTLNFYKNDIWQALLIFLVFNLSFASLALVTTLCIFIFPLICQIAYWFIASLAVIINIYCYIAIVDCVKMRIETNYK